MLMMDWDRIDTLALEVKNLGVDVVTEKSGVKRARVSRFMKDQKSVTMAELNKIQLAVTELQAAK
jgi:hypothetical protein